MSALDLFLPLMSKCFSGAYTSVHFCIEGPGPPCLQLDHQKKKASAFSVKLDTVCQISDLYGVMNSRGERSEEEDEEEEEEEKRV